MSNTKEHKPTPAMLAMMKSIDKYADCSHHLCGRSAHGGASGTIFALRKRGWAVFGGKDALTPLGKEILTVYTK